MSRVSVPGVRVMASATTVATSAVGCSSRIDTMTAIFMSGLAVVAAATGDGLVVLLILLIGLLGFLGTVTVSRFIERKGL